MSSSSGTSTPKAHNRHLSADDRRRVLRPRSSTKGPLDDPLSVSLPALSLSPSPDPTPRAVTPSPSNPPTLDPELVLASIDRPLRDFGYLLRPEIYHPLSQLDVPQAFRESPYQPSPVAPLPELLAQGHFRAAAIRAASTLTTEVSPTAHAEIFSLLYTRLACLTLINQTVIAAQEVKALEDLNSTFYRDPITEAHLVPWELRVLAVRLQGIGYGDWRRGVMGYYELARDARFSLAKARSKSTPDEAEIRLWQDRLWDLGLRVGNALVEMGDLETAVRHLGSLRPTCHGPAAQAMNTRLALIYLRGGNVTAARQCLARSDENGEAAKEEISGGVVDALCSMADGDFNLAVSQWRALLDKKDSSANAKEEPSAAEGEGSQSQNEMTSHKVETASDAAAKDTTPDNTGPPSSSARLDPGLHALIAQNLAVCLLYSGRLLESRSLLSSLIPPSSSAPAESQAPSPTKDPESPSHPATTPTPVTPPMTQASIFNLCTIYELCTERSRSLKLDLAGQLAAYPPSGASPIPTTASSLPAQSEPINPLSSSPSSQQESQFTSQAWTSQPLPSRPVAVRWEKENATFKL
ncbi:hypothetical protein L228DRAFT_40383 [Xylona heveae TC161]|uniref:TPR-like protein n=1 Tax=Xylona heveae (strain CBS 132557 / TC161) TaxID=1328760 RepID=A0A165A089_XYLHT|nr:hypothetical protein L228DRAFT_40383 [Xylona heveae TC161]KZF19765.1 hypothetical protein L228DRAFT_40383 [Xylona heveae TC161]